MKAVILYGQPGPGACPPDEADTKLQADFVTQRLEQANWSVDIQLLGLNLQRAVDELVRAKPDLVFNLVESVTGRGDLIHLGLALLEYMDLPFTGSSQAALVNTSNKRVTKHLLRQSGLPTPLSRPDDQHPRAADQWIVKSVWEHGSIGLDAQSIVPGAAVRARQLALEAKFGGQWFAEQFIPGREFNVSLLEENGEVRVLAVAEIELDALPANVPRIVDYKAKWEPDSFAYHHTPRRFVFDTSDRELIAQLKQLSLATWRLFDLNGYARVDFRVSSDGQPWILEVNANPCLSPDAGYCAAAAVAGIDEQSLIEIIADTGLRRHARGHKATACLSFAQ